MEPHPVRLVVTDDLRRNRLTVFFRLILAIPHLIWLSLWAIAAFLATISNWATTLVTGRSPEGLHAFLARFIRYETHVMAYLYLLADPFPGFMGDPGYPVDVEIAPPRKQNRWITGFRLLLAVPALILTGVLQYVFQIIGFLGWFYCLATGRMHEGMRDLSAYCFRYQAQTHAYTAILTDRYPGLSSPTSPSA